MQFAGEGADCANTCQSKTDEGAELKNPDVAAITTDPDPGAGVQEDTSGETGSKIAVERDDNWFQTNLKELPSMFNLNRIHLLSKPRLHAIQSVLTDLLKLAISKENDDDGNSDDDSDDDNSTADILTKLLEIDEDELPGLLKKLVKGSRKGADSQTQMWKRAISPRSYFLLSLQTVITWLQGRKQEAEAEARHLLRKWPFSLVAVGNLCYILWKKGAGTEAADFLQSVVTLRERRPGIYEFILCEEKGEIGRCYTELGPEFIPDALVALEETVLRNPQWQRYKFFWALNLRRSTNASRSWKIPVADIIPPLLKAVDLLLQVLQVAEEEDLPEMKASAASELGEILNSCQFEEELKRTVGQRGRDAGLDAAKCFDIVMKTKDSGGSNLVRAGKFFRYTRQLRRSEQALKKAVEVQDSAKTHHQLALTLKKMAVEERHRARQAASRSHRGARRPQSHYAGPKRGANRQSLGTISQARMNAGDPKMVELERAMKAQMYQNFSRADKHVKEAIHHFRKALEVSNGENMEVSYDLGLMYKALGEHGDALKLFSRIAEIDTEPANVVRALEQAGLVYLEMCGLEKSDTAARKLQENGRAMLSMAILVQTDTVQQFRKEQLHRQTSAIWQSFHALGQYLRLDQDVGKMYNEESKAELWLRRLLRVYADTVPVLISLQQFALQDASDPEVLASKLCKYLRDQPYEDKVIFLRLLRLTDYGHVLESGFLDLGLRAHVQAARARLLREAEEGNQGCEVNTEMAKRFFHWAFEDAHPVSGVIVPVFDCGHQASGDTHDPTSQDTSPVTEALPANAAPNTESSQDSETRETTVDGLQSPPPQLQNVSTSATQSLTGVEQGATCAVMEQQDMPILPEMSTADLGTTDDAGSLMENHVLLVSDPADPEAMHAAELLQTELSSTCGLTTLLTTLTSGASQKVDLEAVNRARLLLLVLGKEDLSSNIQMYIREVTARSPAAVCTDAQQLEKPSASRVRHNFLILTLSDAASLPSCLQNYPSFPWRMEAVSTNRRTKGWIDTVCKLFCFLVGIDMKF